MVSPAKLRLLALLLAQPGPESLAELSRIAERESWLAPAVAELEALPLERWQAEHTRLFLNGHPRTLAPPFESAYRGGRLFGEPAESLGALYAEAGLRSSGPAPDFLGTELEFAAWLMEKEENPGLLRRLWREHLSLWLPAFCRDLRAGAGLLLYRSLAERLDSVLGEVDGERVEKVAL